MDLGKFYVYVHRTDDGRVFNVGKGQKDRAFSLKDRSAKHKRISKKYGRNVEILWHTDDEEAAYAYEGQLIDFFGTFTRDWKNGIECNFTLGGEGFRGNHSFVARQKMSSSHKGKKKSAEARKNMSASRKGKPVSPATIAAAVKAHKGVPKSEEQRKKISLTKTGCKDSPETRAKKSAAHKGVPKSPECRAKLSLAKTGKVYPKITQALLGKRKSDECRRNISKAKMGKPMSDEAKASMSRAKKGVPWTPQRRAAYLASKEKKAKMES